MNRKSFGQIVFGGILLQGISGLAATLALWPLEVDETGNFDGRCLVNPAGALEPALASALSFEPSALGWQRPPNPDPYGHWMEIDNRQAAVHASTLCGFAKMTSATPELFHALTIGDFTVEGWVKFDGLPARSEWHPYFNSAAGGVITMLSLRHTRKSADAVTDANPDGWVYTLECYHRGSAADNAPGGDYSLVTIREEEIASFAAQWHHVALMVDHSNPNSTKMRFYLDGELKNERQVAKFKNHDNGDFMLHLGGRGDDSVVGRYDYWRISDTALAPSEFLCHDPEGKGGAVIVAPPSSTVAYWKLDPDETGELDLRNAVGDYAHLKKNAFNSPPGMATDFQWAEYNAFEPVTGGRDGNGSVTLQSPGMGLKTYDLGTRLTPTESFSVAGWYNPEQREGMALFDTNAFGRVFAVADPDTVWALLLKKKPDGSRVFAIEAIDDTTSADGSALASGEFTAVLPRAAQWHHVKLDYDASTENGRWTLTFNDKVAGTVDNVRKPVYAGTVSATNVYLGSTTVPGTAGRTKSKSNPDYSYTAPPRAANDWVFGVYDSWSVSVAGTEIANWPLDTVRKNGNVWISGRDTVGTFHFAGLAYDHADYGNAVETEDKAIVTNPDRSASFRGDASVNAGSAGITGSRAFFTCDDPRVLTLFGDGTKDFTFEYFQKRTQAMRNWEIVFTGDTENFGYTTDKMNFSSRADGFRLWMAAMNVGSDKLFENSLTPVNDTTSWHHIAFVRKYDPVTKSATATLYQDGVACSSITGTACRHALVNMCFFARTSGNNLAAYVDEIRLSNAALTPSQFLNATPEAAVTPEDNTRKTLSYWELDDADGAADLANAIIPACPLAGAAAGAAAMADAKVRNPDTTALFFGAAAVNGGSVAASEPLVSAYAGLNLELDRPFTVEGWVKPLDPGTAGRDVCVVSNEDGSGYWRLRLLRDGTSVRLAVQAASPHAWTLCPIDAAFPVDFATRLGAWTHLGISYDPADGNGTWRLFVNGRDGGSFEQTVSPGLMAWDLTRFALGAADGGSFDEWRISRGALTAADLLYRDIPRFLLLVR